jgi:nicotinamidase-related amidase
MVTDEAKIATYEKSGFGGSARRGNRPAVICVDFTYGFTDPVFPTAYDYGSEIAETRRLIDVARAGSLPVIFTTIAYAPGEIEGITWLRKATGMRALVAGSRLVEVDARLAPRPQEPLIVKHGASAFHGTNLASLLCGLQVDTVIVTGATTSGCVRATVVDAVQHGFDVLVPADCVGDRAQDPHHANLFDIQQKYGDVITAQNACAYLAASKR